MPTAPSPVGPRDAVELRLARSATVFLVVLGIPTIGVAALLAGTAGAASAAVGAAVVIGMFLMAGATMSWAARIGPAALMAAVLGGYLVRLMIYAALILLLRPVPWLSGPSLAISTAVLLVAVLAWEVRVVSRTPWMFWVDAAAGGARRTASAGVVEPHHSGNAGAAPATPGSAHIRTPSIKPSVERTRP